MNTATNITGRILDTTFNNEFCSYQSVRGLRYCLVNFIEDIYKKPLIYLATLLILLLILEKTKYSLSKYLSNGK